MEALMPLVPVREAREIIGVSREKMRKLIAAGTFTIYANPRDAREKLIDTDELQAYMEPRPAIARQKRNGRESVQVSGDE